MITYHRSQPPINRIYKKKKNTDSENHKEFGLTILKILASIIIRCRNATQEQKTPENKLKFKSQPILYPSASFETHIHILKSKIIQIL